MRRQALAGGAALAVAVACAGCGGTSPLPPAGTVVTGPIQLLVTSDSMTPGGGPVGVTSYYRGDTRKAVAVAVLGKLSGPAELVMTWSRLTAAGPQVLFSKDITVSSYGRAYSWAISRGTLPLGNYQVSASVAGVTRTAEWEVFAPLSKRPADYARTASPVIAGSSGALAQPPKPANACDRQQVIVSMQTTTKVDVNISAYCPVGGKNKATRGALLATMGHGNGTTRLIGTMHLGPGGIITGNFAFNVCSLPGGSDQPRQDIQLTTLVYYLGTSRDFTALYGIPADHSDPIVSIASSVPAGTAVHPGEKIRLKLVANEPAHLGPQTGIRDIRLDGPSGPGPSVRLKSTYYPRIAAGCNTARNHRSMTVTYTVPAVAPKVITLVATASDFPNHTATATVSFPFAR
jgi:hypothetical protein